MSLDGFTYIPYLLLERSEGGGGGSGVMLFIFIPRGKENISIFDPLSLLETPHPTSLGLSHKRT
jgi:hypothetical protein